MSGAEPFDRLVLDTSAYSHFRIGHPRVVELVASVPFVIVPVVVLGELEAAFRLGSRLAENMAMLAEFLAESFVAPWDVTSAVARRYGEIFAQLRRGGTPIPINDVWIASITLECRGHLVTFDNDFSRVAGLSVTVLA
jgi:tRNA(fMet)-specific endonuclease VapC